MGPSGRGVWLCPISWRTQSGQVAAGGITPPGVCVAKSIWTFEALCTQDKGVMLLGLSWQHPCPGMQSSNKWQSSSRSAAAEQRWAAARGKNHTPGHSRNRTRECQVQKSPIGEPGRRFLLRGPKSPVWKLGWGFSREDKNPPFGNRPYYMPLPHLGKMMAAGGPPSDPPCLVPGWGIFVPKGNLPPRFPNRG